MTVGDAERSPRRCTDEGERLEGILEVSDFVNRGGGCVFGFVGMRSHPNVNSPHTPNRFMLTTHTLEADAHFTDLYAH